MIPLISVDILLKATGNAPIMKKKKWAVDAEKPIGWIMEFVKKYLKLNDDEKLVSFYVASYIVDTFLILILFSVFICESNFCSFSRPDCKKSLRMFRNRWKINFALLQKSSMGMKLVK